MKTAFVTLFVSALLAGSVAAQGGSEQSTRSAVKPIVVSGKVSADGRTLMTDIDSAGAVSNSVRLKGFEGRMVKVKCYVDTAKSELHIITVKPEDAAPSHGAEQMSSAFRR